MSWLPHGALPTEYANIEDYGAVEVPDNGTAFDSTDAIRRAIATGLHVVIPTGEFYVYDVIHFGNLTQRCTFFGRGRIRLVTAEAQIRITGSRQVFERMWVTAQAGVDFQPCVLVEGADDVLFLGLLVGCTTNSTLLELRDCANIRLVGGEISGGNPLNDTTGILFSGVRGFGSWGLTVHQLQYGVVFATGTQNHCVAFQDGTIEACFEHQVEVRGAVYGLSMLGWHMESGTDDELDSEGKITSRAGAAVFVRVLEGGGVYGGVFAGSVFGAQRTKQDGVPRRVFQIGGDWHGVSVYGCWHLGTTDDSFETASIWELESTASVENSGDYFNSWDNALVLEDPTQMAAILYDPDSTNQLGIRISGSSFRARASKIGFFGAEPVEPPTYTLGREYDERNLGASTVEDVLGTLLRDLAALGLVKLS